MVIDCKHVWGYISDYLDATLPEDVRLDVQKHLEHCEICSAILDSTRNIIILTADERVFELPTGCVLHCDSGRARRDRILHTT
jgi:hypothetical protein